MGQPESYEAKLTRVLSMPDWDVPETAQMREAFAAAQEAAKDVAEALNQDSKGLVAFFASLSATTTARRADENAESVPNVHASVARANERLAAARQVSLPQGSVDSRWAAALTAADVGATIAVPGYGVVTKVLGVDPLKAVNALFAGNREAEAKKHLDSLQTDMEAIARSVKQPDAITPSPQVGKVDPDDFGLGETGDDHFHQGDIIAKRPRGGGGTGSGSGNGSGSGGYVIDGGVGGNPGGNGGGSGGSGGGSGGGNGGGSGGGNGGGNGGGSGGGNGGGGSGGDNGGGSGGGPYLGDGHHWGGPYIYYPDDPPIRGNDPTVDDPTVHDDRHTAVDSNMGGTARGVGYGLLGAGTAGLGLGAAVKVGRSLTASAGGVGGGLSGLTGGLASGSGSLPSYPVNPVITNPNGSVVTPESAARSGSGAAGRGMMGGGGGGAGGAGQEKKKRAGLGLVAPKLDDTDIFLRPRGAMAGSRSSRPTSGNGS